MHFSFLVYSFVGVFSKTVALQEYFSLRFFIYIGIVIFILFIYALLWQQVLKQFSLIKAYSSKGIVVMWNMLWAVIFFGESITINNVIGGTIIIVGIAVVSSDAS